MDTAVETSVSAATVPSPATKQCNPWNPKFALVWYVILYAIAIIFFLVLPLISILAGAPYSLVQIGASLLIASIFFVLFAWLMFRAASRCDVGESWLWFIVAIVVGILVSLVTTAMWWIISPP